jgi:hypothetical protein
MGETVSDGPVDFLAREASRQQFRLLIGRHRHEDVILVRVLAEHYHQVAIVAKNGAIDTAERQFESLARGVPVPAIRELRLVVDVASHPVLALINFRRSLYDSAATQLERALDACGTLASEYGHGYLTGKQLHLALNVARVATTQRDTPRASDLLSRIEKVIQGDRSAWSFGGGALLALPLAGATRAMIRAQLTRETHRLAEMEMRERTRPA